MAKASLVPRLFPLLNRPISLLAKPSFGSFLVFAMDGLLIHTLRIWLSREWHPTPVLLPGKFHGRRSLVGCSPRGREESDTTERLPFHFSLSCIGEGNGNPLQCSCLENPREGGIWWASVYGVAQSQTRLKRLSSSSSNREENLHVTKWKLHLVAQAWNSGDLFLSVFFKPVPKPSANSLDSARLYLTSGHVSSSLQLPPWSSYHFLPG